MSLTPGTRIGPYEIHAPLGAGGMGEVYRARDTRLKREVAIKVLPAAFAQDPDRLARFQREAEVLATLNHPNIAAIYGLEASSGEHALVLELVEGPTLADRIALGPLSLDDVLSIARQIAEALHDAHRRNVIHRDLKPANIKVRPDGTVKVLDFGLAKALTEGDRPLDGASMSPTMTTPADLRHGSGGHAMTGTGVILGTAAYMSPEQARGKPVDRRSDIWAFGCVLYEMLAGRRPFEAGETVSDAVAAILTREPDWSLLPPGVPGPLRRLLRRCLQKDPDRRLHDIADARFEIEDAPTEPPVAASSAPADRSSGRRWARALPWGAASLALGFAAWSLWRGPVRDADSGPIRRLEINLPAGIELFSTTSRTLAVSPDGSRLAFVGVLGGSRQVYVRALDEFDAVPVRGSESATTCFFSPDGGSIGLVTAAGVLKTVSLVDGLVTTVTDNVGFLYGAAWGTDGRIVFGRAGSLWRVAQSGGTPEPLTTVGGPDDDTLHAWPALLPDGRTLLFGAASGERWRIEALTLATAERRTVVEEGTLPLYTASGYLAFFRNGELLAAPFDEARLELSGPAIQAIDTLPAGVAGLPIVDVSLSGTMAYAPTTAVSRLVWVSRDGAEQPLNDVLRSYTNPRLSPDGSQLVVQHGDDLWLQDVARATFTRLTPNGSGSNAFPIWTPDGRRVLFRSPNGLILQEADGSGRGDAIPGTSEWDYPGSVSVDGTTLVFLRSSQVTSFDVYTLPMEEPAQVSAVLQTGAYEGGARLSPDGRWMTYVSDESGRYEVYLRPFPGPDRRWPVSTDGGTQAVWSPNGREVFYRNGDRMMVVDLLTDPGVTLSPPRLLFERRYAFGAGITIANYDVAPDGQRFVMVKGESGAGRLNVVLNRFSAMRALTR